MTKGVQHIFPGDTIGVAAVTAPAEPGRFEKGVRYLENLGYKVKVALKPTAGYGKSDFLFGSDTPEQRAKGLMSLFKDKDVKAILTTRGSYGAMEVLPHLDFKAMAKNKKPVIGFSDITALLNPLAKAGCPAIHGPVLEFGFARAYGGEDGAVEGVKSLLALLSGDEDNPFSREKLVHVKGAKRFSGEIVGGNLSIVASLLGTPWQVSGKKKIIFIEEVGEGPYRVHRLLLQLKLSGFFEDAAGVVLGDFTKCEHPEKLGPTIDQVIEDIFSDVDAPLVRGLPCGHGKRNLPLPFEEAEISSGRISFR